ncbi:hypothetical protein CEXT_452901 [Caerostris extrusa]|uniref:Cytochrome P450 n=1 Tax=Caerostris extrusa TaxID=172846 RepID=A0AAV4RIB7_CAEEX|nr:hypothetical protein CEXT_452901 [Caerostris extrusa]
MMPDGLGLTSLNGKEWSEQRKITMKIMHELGLGKSKWQECVQDEVDAFIHHLEKQRGEPHNVKSALIASICNNVFSLIFGYNLTPDHPKMTIIRNLLISFPEVFRQTGLLLLNTYKTHITHIKDTLIANRFIREDVEKKKEQRCNRRYYLCERLFKQNAGRETQKEAAHIMYSWCISIRNKYSSGPEVIQDFVIVLQRVLINNGEDAHCSYHILDKDTILIGNIQSLILGGIDTTMTTLLWLFFAMASYPKIQQKVFEEVDDVLGNLINLNGQIELNYHIHS